VKITTVVTFEGDQDMKMLRAVKKVVGQTSPAGRETYMTRADSELVNDFYDLIPDLEED